MLGRKFPKLIAQVNPELSDACSTYLADTQLGPLLDRLKAVSKASEPMPCIDGLLSKLIKPTELNSSLVTLWGADQFWDNQRTYAPVCEISSELGICAIWKLVWQFGRGRMDY